ncbi:MAG TPA: type I-U CRISPR-associated protein Csx17 [Terriglobales bacterium]
MPATKHRLTGCAPLPLSGYLKALGVFRLVSEQADPAARGYWEADRFILESNLEPDELISFFADRYRPTPVVAPWNGGSGFWQKDNKVGLDWILSSVQPRLAEYRRSIEDCAAMITATGWQAPPKAEAKASFVSRLRSRLSDEVCRWLDAAVVLETDKARFPPLLGTGGNDGRLDFSNNFMRRLQSALSEAAGTQLRASLFAISSPDMEKGAVGQFAPGSAGGPNNGVGFDAASWINPWDYVLCLEGTMLFAAAAARRYGQDSPGVLSYPFTTLAVGTGSGATAFADEADARAELWAPLWSRPAGFAELSQLFSEGRAVLNGREARDGLDFARAASQLGVARGIDQFQRHAFLMRSGRAYFAVPLSRLEVRERPAAALLAQLDERNWLSRTRRLLRDDKQPASVRAVGQRLDDSIFALAAEGDSPALQGVLGALGDVVLAAAQRPSLRRDDGGMQPPPPLRWNWVEYANDGSPEFALAWAVASLDAVSHRGAENTPNSSAHAFRMPFRSHLAPLSIGAGWTPDSWADGGTESALAVWEGRNLVRDLAATLVRRLIEAERYVFTVASEEAPIPSNLIKEQPLRGAHAPLSAVLALLNSELDESRVASLACGLAWVRSRRAIFHAPLPWEDDVPLTYALLKPLFFPDGVGPDKHLPALLPLARLIAAGRLEDALSQAQRTARAAKLDVEFPAPTTSTISPERLLAALLIPIGDRARCDLQKRAYPDLIEKSEGDKQCPTH